MPAFFQTGICTLNSISLFENAVLFFKTKNFRLQKEMGDESPPNKRGKE